MIRDTIFKRGSFALGYSPGFLTDEKQRIRHNREHTSIPQPRPVPNATHTPTTTSPAARPSLNPFILYHDEASPPFPILGVRHSSQSFNLHASFKRSPAFVVHLNTFPVAFLHLSHFAFSSSISVHLVCWQGSEASTFFLGIWKGDEGGIWELGE